MSQKKTLSNQGKKTFHHEKNPNPFLFYECGASVPIYVTPNSKYRK